MSSTIHEDALSMPLVRIHTGDVSLYGDLELPADAIGLVLFAHGSGSGRNSPRNRRVAQMFHQAGIGTLVFDLLTREEEQEDQQSGIFQFNIPLLAERLWGATSWLENQEETWGLKLGYFGSSTGGAAALKAAAESGDQLSAAVLRGGRPDLAGDDALAAVRCPTLLIVGSNDVLVSELNRQAFGKLRCEKELHVIEGATHLFQEPGALDQVAHESACWFRRHMLGFAGGC